MTERHTQGTPRRTPAGNLVLAAAFTALLAGVWPASVWAEGTPASEQAIARPSSAVAPAETGAEASPPREADTAAAAPAEAGAEAPLPGEAETAAAVLEKAGVEAPGPRDAGAAVAPAGAGAGAEAPLLPDAVPPGDADVAAPLPPAAANEGSAEPASPPEELDEPGPPVPAGVPLITDEEARGVESTEALPTPSTTPRAQRPEVVIKTILGLVALLALAYLGGHPRMRRIERRLRISQAVTAGFPFVALGVVANLPSVGVLTDSVLDQLTPILRFGLGWIGFATGLRFETRAFDDLPKGTAAAVGLATAVPFLTVVTAASLLLLFASDWGDSTFSDPIFLRDALILGTAGAMTARSATRLVNGGGDLSVRRLSKIIQLEQFAGIAGLAFIAAYFRPHGPGIGWQLPGTAWLFLTVGLGATVGIVAYVILRRQASSAESVVLLLGTVAFAAGLASALHLSPIVVCFVAGLLLANVPGSARDRLGDALEKLERPIYLLFLVIVGAIVDVDDWRAWVLLVVFVAARLLGKWLSSSFIARYTDFDAKADENWVATRGPIGQLAIAIVVSAQLLFPHGSIPMIVTSVIGGALVTEILVQLLARGGSAKGDGTPSTGGAIPFPDEGEPRPPIQAATGEPSARGA